MFQENNMLNSSGGLLKKVTSFKTPNLGRRVKFKIANIFIRMYGEILNLFYLINKIKMNKLLVILFLIKLNARKNIFKSKLKNLKM